MDCVKRFSERGNSIYYLKKKKRLRFFLLSAMTHDPCYFMNFDFSNFTQDLFICRNFLLSVYVIAQGLIIVYLGKRMACSGNHFLSH